MMLLQIFERKRTTTRGNILSGPQPPPPLRQVGQEGFGFIHFDNAEAALRAAQMVKGDGHTTLDCQLSVNLRRSLDGSYQYIPRPHLLSIPSTSTSRSPRPLPRPPPARHPSLGKGHVQPRTSKATTIQSPLSRPLQNHHHSLCATPQSSKLTKNSSEIISPQWHDASDPCTIIHMPMMLYPHAYQSSPMSPQMSSPMSPPMPPVYYHLPAMIMEGGTSPHHFHHHQPQQSQQPGAFWYTHDTNIHDNTTATHSTSTVSTMDGSMASSMSYPMYDISSQDHLRHHVYDTRNNHSMVPMPMMMMSPMANHHPSNHHPSTMHHEYPMQMHTEGTFQEYSPYINGEGGSHPQLYLPICSEVGGSYCYPFVYGERVSYVSINMEEGTQICPSMYGEEIPPGRVVPPDEYRVYDSPSHVNGLPMPMPLSIDTSVSNHHPQLPASPIPTYPVPPIIEMNSGTICHTISTKAILPPEAHIEGLLALKKENETSPPPSPPTDFVETFMLDEDQTTIPAYSA